MRTGTRSSSWRSFTAAGALAALVGGWFGALVPPAIPIAYGVMSTVAFALYRRDKRAARAGRTRTTERTLHLVDLLCGWPDLREPSGSATRVSGSIWWQLVPQAESRGSATYVLGFDRHTLAAFIQEGRSTSDHAAGRQRPPPARLVRGNLLGYTSSE